MSQASLFSLDPARHVPHALHRAERDWGESNCYVDLWIELLHTLGLEPRACLAFTLSVDFEGDQWTFFKPPPGDLLLLYGLDVQELNVWRPLQDHTLEQLRLGRPVLLEADAFFLPDTAGTDYRTRHAKTTIAAAEIDLTAGRLGYFHNGGYHALSGDDFQGVFLPAGLPPYVEFVRLGALQRLPPPALLANALTGARAHLGRRPKDNPVERFRRRFEADLGWLRGAELEAFHGYAFATLRQFGAASELGAAFLRWLASQGEAGPEPAAAALGAISGAAKTLLLKTARTVSARRPLECGALFDTMTASWAQAMEHLVSWLGA